MSSHTSKAPSAKKKDKKKESSAMSVEVETVPTSPGETKKEDYTEAVKPVVVRPRKSSIVTNSTPETSKTQSKASASSQGTRPKKFSRNKRPKQPKLTENGSIGTPVGEIELRETAKYKNKNGEVRD